MRGNHSSDRKHRGNASTSKRNEPTTYKPLQQQNTQDSMGTEDRAAMSSLTTNSSPLNDSILVFSCKTCRSIVGDSLSFVCSHDRMRTITLSGVSNKVAPEQAFHTSSNHIDKGATYCNLLCVECVHAIGKVYQTTPRSLDSLREKYTFYLDNLDSYQLGAVSMGSSSSVADMPSSKETQNVAEDITKIQHVLVDLVLRLTEVERMLGVVNAEAPNGVPIGTDSAIATPQYHNDVKASSTSPDKRQPKRSQMQSSSFLLGESRKRQRLDGEPIHES